MRFPGLAVVRSFPLASFCDQAGETPGGQQGGALEGRNGLAPVRWLPVVDGASCSDRPLCRFPIPLAAGMGRGEPEGFGVDPVHLTADGFFVFAGKVDQVLGYFVRGSGRAEHRRPNMLSSAQSLMECL